MHGFKNGLTGNELRPREILYNVNEGQKQNNKGYETLQVDSVTFDLIMLPIVHIFRFVYVIGITLWIALPKVLHRVSDLERFFTTVYTYFLQVKNHQFVH